MPDQLASLSTGRSEVVGSMGRRIETRSTSLSSRLTETIVAHIRIQVVIYPFGSGPQQYWRVQFIRYKHMNSILPVFPNGSRTEQTSLPAEDQCHCGTARAHGGIPSPPDSNDFIFHPKPVVSPGHGVDLRPKCPPVWHQGTMSSCTAHAVAAAFEFAVTKQGLPDFSPSRLFIWYHARQKASDINAVLKDCGSYIRDAIKSLDVKVYGVCSEMDWDYEVAPSNQQTHFFSLGARAAVKPPNSAYRNAHDHTAAKYWAIQNDTNALNNLINCLDQGWPVVLGMKTFGMLRTAKLDMPKAADLKQSDQGHSVLIVGYIPSTQPTQGRFIVRNSWGVTWGDKGYFTMPYDFALKYGYEFWTIRVVKSD